MRTSWRTTLIGIMAAIAATIPPLIAAIDGDASTVSEWGPVIPAWLAAFAFGVSRDNKVSSEQAHAGFYRSPANSRSRY